MNNLNKQALTLKLSESASKYFDNELSALVPENWGYETLLRLKKQSVFPHLVHRDFEKDLAQHGDTVNAHLPASFDALRKGISADIVIQNAKATSVPVKLDQLIHTSFLIRDGEEAISFKDLVPLFLEPAVDALVEQVDATLAGQVFHFLGSTVGKLGLAPDKRTVALLKGAMTNQRVPKTGRTVVLSADTGAELSALDAFSDADRVGDKGTALREGNLGRKYGADYYEDIAIPTLTSGVQGTVGAVNLVAGYPKGYEGAIIKDGVAVFGAHSVVLINSLPYTVVASTPTSITLSSPLKEAVLDNAVISRVVDGAWGGAYPAGHDEDVIVTGLRGQEGEAFRTASGVTYTVVKVRESVDTYTLDRPLDAAVISGAALGVYPDGNYNFAFHKHALAMVTRPLPAPMSGTGANSVVINDNGFGIRVTVGYSMEKQGHIVTLDFLLGVKVLNTSLGSVLLA